MNWRDPDYTENIIDVLKIIGEDSKKLIKIANYIDLEEWLKRVRVDLHNELYSERDSNQLLDENNLDTDVFDISKQLERIYGSLEENPELALGTTKEMIETVLKTMLSDNVESLDMPELIKAVQNNIKLIPDEVVEANKATNIVKRTLNNLGQIVIGITELRNAYGTGHGKLKNNSGLKDYHARLVVNAGVTLVKFLTEVYQEQK